MLNSAEHENVSANKYELAFSYLFAEKISCSAMYNERIRGVQLSFANLWLSGDSTSGFATKYIFHKNDW